MNKVEFIKELSCKLNCDIEYAYIISDLLENNFLLGKKNKKKLINHFISELDISLEEANNIYNVASSIIFREVKNKLKHPFKNLDKE
jgi:hypothetical protein